MTVLKNNYETVIYGNSTQHGDRVKIVEFKSVDVPEFVLKNKWYIIYIDGKADFCIPSSVYTDHDTYELED